MYLKNANIEDVISFYNAHYKIIVKPLGGTCGIGVFIPKSLEEITSLIGSELLVEEFVFNHQDVAKFSNSPLNTVRFYTVREADGVKRIKATIIRIGAKITQSIMSLWVEK